MTRCSRNNKTPDGVGCSDKTVTSIGGGWNLFVFFVAKSKLVGEVIKSRSHYRNETSTIPRQEYIHTEYIPKGRTSTYVLLDSKNVKVDQLTSTKRSYSSTYVQKYS